MTKQMIVFDVDGVLLDNKMGGFKDILVILGKEREVLAIDKEYQKRKHQGPWGLEQLAELYKGFSEKELRVTADRYIQRTLRRQAKGCLVILKKRGYIVGSLSSNPQFLMDVLTEILSLDFSQGTQLEFKDGRATGKIQKKVDRYGKAELLKEKIKIYGLEKHNVIVVGDSITDLPMGELAGTFVAFRPKDDIVKEKADSIIKTLYALVKKEI